MERWNLIKSRKLFGLKFENMKIKTTNILNFFLQVGVQRIPELPLTNMEFHAKTWTLGTYVCPRIILRRWKPLTCVIDLNALNSPGKFLKTVKFWPIDKTYFMIYIINLQDQYQ